MQIMAQPESESSERVSCCASHSMPQNFSHLSNLVESGKQIVENLHELLSRSCAGKQREAFNVGEQDADVVHVVDVKLLELCVTLVVGMVRILVHFLSDVVVDKCGKD